MTQRAVRTVVITGASCRTCSPATDAAGETSDRAPGSFFLSSASVRLRCIRDRSTRLLVGLLLVPALALRMLVPPGFMPGTSAHDAPTMQMCHGAGPVPAATQPVPGEVPPAQGKGQHHESPCVFAAAGFAAPPPIAALTLHAPQLGDDVAPAPEFAFVEKTQHRAQAARAPPARRSLA